MNNMKSEFHLKVKPWVQKMYILPSETEPTLQCMTVCKPTKNESIFNGTAKVFPVSLLLAGYGGHTSYTFNELFSKPLDAERLTKIKEKYPNGYKQQNVIVINTPNEMKAVIVEAPKVLVDLLKIPQYMLAVPAKIPVSNPADLLKHGIDPKGKTYMVEQIVDIPSDLRVDQMDHWQFKVWCFEHIMKIEYPI
jgi:hypothetical protein